MIVLFLDSVQVFCSNKPDSVLFLIDLEAGVLQKAVPWLFCERLCCSCFASVFTGVFQFFLTSKTKELKLLIFVLIVMLSEYKGFIVRYFILLRVNIKDFMTQ